MVITYRWDKPSKGGHVAIYIRSDNKASVSASVSISEQFELLATKVGLSCAFSFFVVGIFYIQSAPIEAATNIYNNLVTLVIYLVISGWSKQWQSQNVANG